MRAEQPVPVGERSILPGRIATALRPVSSPSIRSTGAANWQKEIWSQAVPPGWTKPSCSSAARVILMPASARSRASSGLIAKPNVAALAMTALGNAYARWFNRPGALVRLPGIIMLVPGSASLRGLLALVQQQNMEAGQAAMVAALNILLALVAGLLFGNILIPTRRNL